MAGDNTSEPLLVVKDLSCAFAPGKPIFENVNLRVNEGDVITIAGRSGGGKTTLLKCIAHLGLYRGCVLLHGKKPSDYGNQKLSQTSLHTRLLIRFASGIPTYRTRVLYVPQRPSLLPSTPRAFVNNIAQYSSRKGSNTNEQAAIELGEKWSLNSEVWDRPWSSLSGGEAQRCALSIACTLANTEILLLDEPTSALDASTAKAVEDYLTSLPESPDSNIKAILWITHSEEQGKLGKRMLRVAGSVTESQVPAAV
ncbi:hypothetical protein FRC03_001542 [Tulasnella sp. 419]|nr:hypothetical protein FRC03_001542 [Tulasnella sp. 419]